MTALLAGNADIAVLPAAAVMPQIKAGKIKALAVATAKRSAALPELPTLAESGLKDIQADAWMGFVVPAKTPEAIVRKLHDELVADPRRPGGAREAQAAVHGRRRRHAGRGARLARRRHRALAADHPEEQHHAGLR